jgi:glucan biosynthesis protein
MTLHLTRLSRLWDTSTPRTCSMYFYSAQKKDETLTVSMEIHKGAIFELLKINIITHQIWRHKNSPAPRNLVQLFLQEKPRLVSL